jgi:hypothetical protein
MEKVARRHGTARLTLACVWVVLAACTTQHTPSAPTETAASTPAAPLAQRAEMAGHIHMSANSDDKGYIRGWFKGEEVQLYYTKSYFCAEPPDSGASSGCELGADAETAPRSGPIPTIYAIAAVGGIKPDLATLACFPGTPCLNHPGMIDASRVGGSPTGPAVPHSHILDERRAGWFHTVNIRVRDINVWNAIAEAKTLEKVRKLQAEKIVDSSGQRLISDDTPTNIYFFIASWR